MVHLFSYNISLKPRTSFIEVPCEVFRWDHHCLIIVGHFESSSFLITLMVSSISMLVYIFCMSRYNFVCISSVCELLTIFISFVVFFMLLLFYSLVAVRILCSILGCWYNGELIELTTVLFFMEFYLSSQVWCWKFNLSSFWFLFVCFE